MLEPAAALVLVLVIVLELIPLLVLDVLAAVELLLVLLTACTHPIGEKIGPGCGPLFPISTIIIGHVLRIALLKTAERFVESKESVMPMKGVNDSRVDEVKACES